MKNLVILFSLLVIVGVSSTTIEAQNNVSVIVIENVYYFDELDYAFYQSYNAYISGNTAQSGARLRRAAYFVRQEANAANPPNKKPILNQAERLEMLADSIAMDKIESAWTLRRAYVKTLNTLASHHHLRAAEYWAADKVSDAGHAMVKAAGYVGHAAKWSGKKIEQGAVGLGKGTVAVAKATGGAVSTGAKATGKAVTKGAKATAQGAEVVAVESVRGVRWIGGKMIKGIGFVPEKVGQGLEWLGSSVKKIGEEVEPNTRTK